MGRARPVGASLAAAEERNLHFDSIEAGWTASTLSRLLAVWTDGSKVRELRRRNYVQLAAMLGDEGPRPLRPALPAGASPYVFPVLTDAPQALRDYLFRHGFETLGPWRRAHPAVPACGFTHETRLRAWLVGLPIHHGLEPADIVRLGEAIRLWRPPA